MTCRWCTKVEDQDPDQETGRSVLCCASVLSPLGPQHQHATSLQPQSVPVSVIHTIYRGHTCNSIHIVLAGLRPHSSASKTRQVIWGPDSLPGQVHGLPPPSCSASSGSSAPWNLGWDIGASRWWAPHLYIGTALLYLPVSPRSRNNTACPIHGCCVNRELWSASPGALISSSPSPASPPSRP